MVQICDHNNNNLTFCEKVSRFCKIFYTNVVIINRQVILYYGSCLYYIFNVHVKRISLWKETALI